ncbi:serine/threonine-protein kinase [Pyxidicoccus xibeiensis]|uniref:serine/threonine-protein kinase n=1 Tax=Pyxidicoccus xibeiensis TaxID=2906759 RepID=UPI0020A781AF|nr:serine/threonine-protein kinase [Pyxidicoccus xibeiensis]MCP3144190.1 serine/threonine protein kinase [Pyxidicoccus xibeiensis]
MATRKGRSSGAEVLFRTGDATFELTRELGCAPQGVRLLLARRIASGVVEQRVLKALPLPAGGALTPQEVRARRRLEEAVRLSGYLQHPAMARVYGLHEAEDTLFLEMEYVPGLSVDDLVALSLARRRFFPEDFLVHIGLQVAQALAYAHALRDERGMPLGIIHRDIQPHRIRVGMDGTVKLTDFGIAWSRLPERAETSFRRPHGSHYFAAPEVLFVERVDARADLFSLGAVLLELGTGRNVYSRPDVLEPVLEERLSEEDRARVERGVMAAADAELPLGEYEAVALQAATFRSEDLERLAEPLTSRLRFILHGLLHPDPGERYESADALVADLLSLRRELGPYASSDVEEALRRALSSAGRRLVEEEMDEDLASLLRREDISTEP